MIKATAIKAVLLLPRRSVGSIPNTPKIAFTAGCPPFKIVFQTVPITALEESTGTKRAAFAIFPSTVSLREEISIAKRVELTISNGTMIAAIFKVLIMQRCNLESRNSL